MTKNFALIGAAGYIAPKHMMAIKATGNNLVAALDPHDSVGILDRYFPEASFFTETERFYRHIEKRRRSIDHESVDYVSICSPNYLHDAHVRLALRSDADAICEKPLVINPWNLDQLCDCEQEYGKKINTILQLRLHPSVVALKEKYSSYEGERPDIVLTYITRRGRWYHHSWKGGEDTSGGLAMNIGVHFFDFLIWVFGAPTRSVLHANDRERMSGTLELEKARVRWFLSVSENDLPAEVRGKGDYAHRSITIGDEEVDLSAGFTDLHTRVYEEILAGRGFGIDQARKAIDLIYQIRNSKTQSVGPIAHPFMKTQQSRMSPPTNRSDELLR